MSTVSLPTLGEDGRLVEGVMSTLNEDGSVNISPMGPIVDERFNVLVFRPFKDSNTYRNLSRHRQGVFHITDDVDLIAKSAVGELAPLPRVCPARSVEGQVLADACRWYETVVQSVDDSAERCTVVARTVSAGRNRDFLGFNRAQAAVLEAAILATRIHLIDAEEIHAAVERLRTPVIKTGGRSEIAAFEYLCEYIHDTTSRYHAHV